ncbi:unnamed protein product [Notodromas monacha]|uniref:Phospholysine phosphohistidine inorganic pyrophosphate phosphatase n=1 Tax=Notodromas monacha TaxID=399045 RepID=A0A7R9GAA8_9CRUS|nr:unnamed protein product [Notodromas monacha]CAG0913908.1 unnamed protein product [Notodromas monacha]
MGDFPNALRSAWLPRNPKVRGFLLDITGVLYESGGEGGKVIPGSVEAIQRIRNSGVPVKFLSNETQTSRIGIVKKLRKHGFDLCVDDIITPCPAVVAALNERQLRPYLVVHPDALPEFDEISTNEPNCVVIADAAHHLSYENLNTAFRVLMNSEEKILFTLGKGKFYQEDGELTLDVGPFATGLEYACGVTAEVIGKPSESYFLEGAKRLGMRPEEVVMIGDDIESDVGGAMKLGMTGILVRTGKYRPTNENHQVKPDAVVDNLHAAIDQFLE